MTKRSWRYDPKAQVYRSAAQGGGYVKYNPSTQQYEHVAAGGGKRGDVVASYSRKQFEGMLGTGQRAESAVSREKLLRARKERGAEVTRIKSDVGSRLYQDVKLKRDEQGRLIEMEQRKVSPTKDMQARYFAQPALQKMQTAREVKSRQEYAAQYDVGSEAFESKIERGRTPRQAIEELQSQKGTQYKRDIVASGFSPLAYEKELKEKQEYGKTILGGVGFSGFASGATLTTAYPLKKGLKKGYESTKEFAIRKSKAFWEKTPEFTKKQITYLKDKIAPAQSFSQLQTFLKEGKVSPKTRSDTRIWEGTEGFKVLSKSEEKKREAAIEKYFSGREAAIGKSKLTIGDKSTEQLMKETREFKELSKGISTGFTTSIRERPEKLALIAGASYVTTGLIAPALKVGGATAILKAPAHRILIPISKGAGLAAKGALVGGFAGLTAARVGAAPTLYEKGKVIGEVGTEAASIIGGGYAGMKFGYKPLQRLAAFREARVQGLESKYLTKVMAKGEGVILKEYNTKIPKSQWLKLTGKELKVVEGRTLFGARGQRLWMTKDTQWLEPGTITRKMVKGKYIYAGEPRAMKDIDVVLKPFESETTYKKFAEGLGFKVDPHSYQEFALRSIPGISKKAVDFGSYKIMSPGEQVSRKFLGLSSSRDQEYYRFAKDLPDFMAGSKTLAKQSGSGMLGNIRAMEQIPFPAKQQAAWWIGKTPKVKIGDWAKTASFKPSMTSSFAGGIAAFPSFKSSVKSPKSSLSFSKSLYPSSYIYSTSLSSSLSKSLSKSSSLSPSKSLSPSRSSLSKSLSSPSPSSPSSYSSSLSSSLSSSMSSGSSSGYSSSLSSGYSSGYSLPPPPPTTPPPTTFLWGYVGRKKRGKTKPTTKRKKGAYRPSLLGLKTGKTIFKEPRLSGAGIRLPTQKSLRSASKFWRLRL